MLRRIYKNEEGLGSPSSSEILISDFIQILKNLIKELKAVASLISQDLTNMTLSFKLILKDLNQFFESDMLTEILIKLCEEYGKQKKFLLTFLNHREIKKYLVLDKILVRFADLLFECISQHLDLLDKNNTKVETNLYLFDSWCSGKQKGRKDLIKYLFNYRNFPILDDLIWSLKAEDAISHHLRSTLIPPIFHYNQLAEKDKFPSLNFLSFITYIGDLGWFKSLLNTVECDKKPLLLENAMYYAILGEQVEMIDYFLKEYYQHFSPSNCDKFRDLILDYYPDNSKLEQQFAIPYQVKRANFLPKNLYGNPNTLFYSPLSESKSTSKKEEITDIFDQEESNLLNLIFS